MTESTPSEVVVGALPAGITLAAEAYDGVTWSVLGHTYLQKSLAVDSFSWLSLDPIGTGVPPHIHTAQDEHIYVLEGEYTLYLDGAWHTASPGDLVRMPRGIAHAYYNRSRAAAKALFWVAPAGSLSTLFGKLHNLTDPAEVVRLSAQHEVDFLPEGSVEGA